VNSDVPTEPRWWQAPAVEGLFFACLAAFGYTLTNTALRYATDVDPFWVATWKSVPGMVICWIWVVYNIRVGKPSIPPLMLALPLAANALMMQIGGNVLFQMALGYGGLALTVPLTFGCILLSGALFGRYWLGEVVTRRSWIALITLMVAIALVSLGSQQATQSVRGGADGVTITVWAVVAAVGFACFSGICFGSGGVIIRSFVMGRLNMVQALVVMNTVSVVSTLAMSLATSAPSDLFGLTGPQWTAVVLAGVLNGLSFFAITRAFQLIPVVKINGVNASQVALCSAAGVIFFGEAATVWLFMGVAATITGLMLLDNSSPEPAPTIGVTPAKQTPRPHEPLVTEVSRSA
jgi:drug/metabolite transporter (DMT)-like permease